MAKVAALALQTAQVAREDSEDAWKLRKGNPLMIREGIMKQAKQLFPQEWAVWNQVDRNSDGVLTREEIALMCKNFCLDAACMDHLWDLLDKDKGVP